MTSQGEFFANIKPFEKGIRCRVMEVERNLILSITWGNLFLPARARDICSRHCQPKPLRVTPVDCCRVNASDLDISKDILVDVKHSSTTEN